MHALYKLEPVVDIPEYEGLATAASCCSVLGHLRAAWDFTPGWSDDDGWDVVSLTDRWVPWEVEGIVRPWNDYPCINLTVPAMSRMAVTGLRDMLEANGELLPLQSTIGEYFAYNVTTILNPVEVANSRINWMRKPDTASTIDRYAVQAELFEGRSIFRLSLLPTSLFVTRPFVDRIRDAKLNGFNPILVWPLPDGADWWELEKKRQKARERKAAAFRKRFGKNADRPPLDPLD